MHFLEKMCLTSLKMLKRCLEQPGIVEEGVPAQGRGRTELIFKVLLTQAILWFCDFGRKSKHLLNSALVLWPLLCLCCWARAVPGGFWAGSSHNILLYSPHTLWMCPKSPWSIRTTSRAGGWSPGRLLKMPSALFSPTTPFFVAYLLVVSTTTFRGRKWSLMDCTVAAGKLSEFLSK